MGQGQVFVFRCVIFEMHARHPGCGLCWLSEELGTRCEIQGMEGGLQLEIWIWGPSEGTAEAIGVAEFSEESITLKWIRGSH